MSIPLQYPSTPSLRIQLFGSYAAQQHGVPLPRSRTRTEQWLLALLILRHDQAVERSWLAAQFWPESREGQALYNLRRSLSDLRRVLGEEAYRLTSPTPHTVRLELSGVFVDVIAFDAAMGRDDAASRETAVALHRGPLLEGCPAEWVLPERERRFESYLTALETLAAQSATRQNYGEAAHYLRLSLTGDPLRETAQQALMHALFAAGDFAGACAAYHQFRRRLHDELQSEPAPATSALYRRIRQESRSRGKAAVASYSPAASPAAGLAPASTSPPTTFPLSRSRLPHPLTPLIGREQEIAEAEKRLGATRLLTLTGMGGIGKTRLAIAVAEEVAEAYTDGAWFVELASLTAADSVLQAVATVFGVAAEPGCSLLQAVEEALRPKSLLLVLDNCEHLVEACARLAETLLGSIPGLHILATSRHSLNVRGEHRLLVPTLSLPAADALRDRDAPDIAALTEGAAAHLFIERARAVASSFQVTRENAAPIGRICLLLDGIPLALELAAAWTKALPIAQIADRIDHRLEFLTSGSGSASPRQQTLRATLDWSYHLLSETEQQLLQRLSVFAGGCTLEAAEAICSDSEPPSQPAPLLDQTHDQHTMPPVRKEEVLPLLSRLIDKSLVVFSEEGGQARYHLLATTHEYAAEQGSAGDRLTLTRRHADYFLGLALEAFAAMQNDTNQPAWRHRLGQDQENLRTALTGWRQMDRNHGAKMALTLWRHGILSYHSTEAHEWIMCLQQKGGLHPVPAAATLYRVAGEWAHWLGNRIAARRLWENAFDVATACADHAGLAALLLLLGGDDLRLGEFSQAQTRFEAGLAYCEAAGNTRQAAQARIRLSRLAFERGEREQAESLVSHSLHVGRLHADQLLTVEALEEQVYQAYQSAEYTTARACLLEVLQLLQPVRSFGMANVLRTLGAVEGLMGDYETAWRYLHEALALHRQCGFRPGEGWTFYDMARVASRQGDTALSRSHLIRSLGIFEALRERGSVEFCLRYWARMEGADGDRQRAANLWGYIEEHQIAASLHEKREQEEHLATLRTAMAPAELEAARRRGRAMSLEEITDYLTSDTDVQA